MEQVELIKVISEFGILIVIAGLYLYERFTDNKDSNNILLDVKSLLEDLKEKDRLKRKTSLSLHEFRDALDLYLSSQMCELIKECDHLITINHIHDNEEETKSRVQEMAQRVHARHRNFIDTFSYNGREMSTILDSQDFISKKAEICTEWILGDNHHPLPLYRALDSYFESFSISLE